MFSTVTENVPAMGVPVSPTEAMSLSETDDVKEPVPSADSRLVKEDCRPAKLVCRAVRDVDCD